MYNNTSIYHCGDITQASDEDAKFKPNWVVMPMLSMWYGYQSMKAYRKHKHHLIPTDILEINALVDRTAFFVMNLVLELGVFLPQDSWVCGLLNYLRLIFGWSTLIDFVVGQIDTFLMFEFDSKYPEKMTTVTASMIAHGTKYATIIMGMILGLCYPQYFHCKPLKEYLHNPANLLIYGVPSLIASIVNITVSLKSSYKIFKKTKQLNPHGPVHQAIKYETDELFVAVSPYISTISQSVQNLDDLEIEDIEEGDFPQDVEENEGESDPDQIEVVPESEEIKEKTTVIKRQDSRHDMFYKVEVQTTQIMCYPIKESTYENLVKILKLNVITASIVIMLISSQY